MTRSGWPRLRRCTGCPKHGRYADRVEARGVGRFGIVGQCLAESFERLMVAARVVAVEHAPYLAHALFTVRSIRPAAFPAPNGDLHDAESSGRVTSLKCGALR